jgi:hypothetical protein
MGQVSEEVQFWSFCCDCEIEPNTTVIDLVLAHDKSLSLGARAFARALRGTRMRLYEVSSIVPGISITLRDVLADGLVTVAERMASRTLNQFDWVAARVVQHGQSGQPEMERGVMSIPALSRQNLRAQLAQLLAAAADKDERAAFEEDLPALIHEFWVGSVLAPRIPELRNTDGEPILITRVHFEVLDQSGLEHALDGHASFSRDQTDRWSWAGPNAHGAEVSIGNIKLDGKSLLLETNSKARAERGTRLLNELAQGAIVERATTHEDPAHALREGSAHEVSDASEPQIPPEIAEALVLDHYAKHYQKWIDEPLPVLDDRSPRAAAQQPALRARLVGLIHELEGMYQRALRDEAPAYDPSWMWTELGLHAPDPKLPPPLLHERLAHFIEGADKLSVEVAEALRKRPGFDDASTVLDRGALLELLEIRRFLKSHPPSAIATDGPAWQTRELAPYLELAVNFALHRRKLFWVDEALSFMLAHTDIDIPASDLRAPFASFAFVFTDRHVLSLGERLLSRRVKSALRGLILRVATVYVTQRGDEAERALDLNFAFDALGDDLPELISHTLTLHGEAPLQTLLPEDDLNMLADPPVATANPLHGLIKVIVNAMLYATSSGVATEARSGEKASTAQTRQHVAPTVTGENVYFLPGAIDITQVRKLQTLSRVGEGSAMLRRSMVRGHWRRAPQTWNDQRLRWIAPYWKGPDLAAVIERAYRLKPSVTEPQLHE